MAGMSLKTAGMLLGGGYESPNPTTCRAPDGESLQLAGLDFVVRTTPGHTRGSVTFGTPDRRTAAEAPGLFSGDLLFARRSAAPTSPAALPERCARLARRCYPARRHVVLPGHDDDTTVGRAGDQPLPRRPDRRLRQRVTRPRPWGRAVASAPGAPEGTYDVPPPPRPLARRPRGPRGAPGRGGLRLREAPIFEDTACSARRGRGDRRRQQGDVHLHRPGDRSMTLRPRARRASSGS